MIYRGVWTLAFILVLSALCAGQTEVATLSGRVTDPGGGVIAGVEVKADNIETNTTRSTMTTGEGVYVLPNLQPGRYRLIVRKEGFNQIVKTEIILHVQDTLAENFILQIGSVDQSITVVAEDGLVSTESAAVGTVIDRQFVENMPLNGRSFQSLILLTPGVVPVASSQQNSGQFSVNGQRSTTNYFSVDGVSANIGIGGFSAGLFDTAGGGSQGQTAAGGYNNLVSIDAIREFKVQTSTYAPEFGRTPGGQFEIVTRSGTNQIHGTVFDYLRNDAFDANDWFANRARLAKSPRRQNDFGGVLGGPIIIPGLYNGRDKTFFFFSYEGLRLRQPTTNVSEVPSVAQRQTATGFYQQFLNAFPVQNGPTQPDGFGLLSVGYSDPSTVDAASVRLDHNFNRRVTVFVRGSYSPSKTQARGKVNLSQSQIESARVRTETLTAGSTQTLSSSAANDLRFNYSRNSAGDSYSLDDFGGAVPFDPARIIPPPVPANAFLAFSVSTGGFSSIQTGLAAANLQRQLNLVDSLSLARGHHQIKIGVDYRRMTPVANPANYQLFLTAAQTDFTNSSISRAITFTNSSVGLTFHNFSLFAQDNWRITPKLVATFGLRWEVNPTPSFDGNDPIVALGLDNPPTATIAPRGTPIYHTAYRNIAPRVGMAYSLNQNQRKQTVLRGGFGLFYDTGATPVGFLTGDAPYVVSRTTANATVPLVPAQVAAPPLSLMPPFSNVFAFKPDIQLPYTMQWSTALEQGLGASQSVTAGYVAALGRRLLQGIQIPTPNSNFSNAVNFTGNLATSDYHSLQLQYRHRLSSGIQILGSYTWSHSIDDISSDVFSVFASISRGNSSFDLRHRGSVAATMDLPAPAHHPLMRMLFGGWGLDPIFNIQSAPPVDIVARASQTIVGTVQSSRPNVVPGIPLYLYGAQYPGGKIINNTPNQGGTGCKGPFCVPPVGQQGNLGRNVLRSFAVSQIDLSLRRQFSFGDRYKLQWRADVFNALNHPNFGLNTSPTGVLTSSLFGQSNSMYGSSLGSGGLRGGFNPLYQLGGPRSMQLSMKLLF